jgi:cytochrome c5
MASCLPVNRASGQNECDRDEFMIVIRSFILIVLCSILLACGEQSAENTEQKTKPYGANKVVTTVAPPDAKKIYDLNCLPCHAEGPGHAGTRRLARRLGEDKSVLTQRDDLNADYVKIIVRQGFSLMPPFRPTEISDSELNALAEYLAAK